MRLPDGTPVAVTGSWDGTARVWDLATGQARHTLTGHTGPVVAVATMRLPDGTPVAVTGSDDRTARVWDLATGQTRHTLTGHTDSVEAVATMRLPDGTPVAVTGSRDRTARVWDLATGHSVHVQPLPYPTQALSSLNRYIVLGFGREIACFEMEMRPSR